MKKKEKRENKIENKIKQIFGAFCPNLIKKLTVTEQLVWSGRTENGQKLSADAGKWKTLSGKKASKQTFLDFKFFVKRNKIIGIWVTYGPFGKLQFNSYNIHKHTHTLKKKEMDYNHNFLRLIFDFVVVVVLLENLI